MSKSSMRQSDIKMGTVPNFMSPIFIRVGRIDKDKNVIANEVWQSHKKDASFFLMN